MPPKKSKRSVQRNVVMRGDGFFQDVGRFFTRTIPNAAKTVYNKALKPAGRWIKDNKVISRGLKAVGSLDPSGRVSAAGNLADTVGLGKRRKRTNFRNPMRGGAKRPSSKIRFA